jgi:type I restriction enzyme M protein
MQPSTARPPVQFEPSVEGAAWRDVSSQNLPELFKKIYYRLYTNSSASRAEVIVEDLSLLLLCKLASESNGSGHELDEFMAGDATANQALLPILSRAYPDLLGSKQTFSIGDVAVRSALHDLRGLKLTLAPAHALGEAFQALIGPRLRGEKGQFFTPRSLVRAMVEILDPQPSESVLDPACGTGGFLAEAVIYQRSRHPAAAVNGQVVGVDKDEGLARMATAMLKVLDQSRSHIFNFSSLAFDSWSSHRKDGIEAAFDVVLTNPPFGSKIGVEDPDVLRQYDLGFAWTPGRDDQPWVKSEDLLPSQDPQVLFLELCVRALKPGGRMGIVLPEGMFGNKGSNYIWDWLEQRGEVFALLDCPRTTFQPGTDTKTNVLFFRRHGKVRLQREVSTKIAVALHCGHDRRGRSHNVSGAPHLDDFPLVAAAFHNTSQTATWKNVALKGSRYLVPRYHFGKHERDTLELDRELTRAAPFTTLAELVKSGLVTIRKGHEVGSDAYGTGDIPFVRTSDLSNFEVSCDPTKSISEEIYAKYAPQQQLVAGDILMVVDGRYRIGTSALLTENNSRCVVQSHLRVLGTPRRSELDPYELLFALNLPSVKLRLRNLVFIQSTLGTLGSRLLELRIPILHGDGVWSDPMRRFRSALIQRDRLLAEIRAMSAPDIEL